MTNHFTILVIVVLLNSSCVGETRNAEDVATAIPENAGMSSKKLSYIDSLVAEYIAENKFPGGVFLVARRGKIVYYKSIGDRSSKTAEPYHKDDIFRIASMTKAITTVAVMQLYEKGKLRLDDPVSGYLPAFREAGVLERFIPADSTFTTVPANTRISIRHLLTHTSGLAYAKPRYGDLFTVYTQLGFGDRSGLSHPEWTTAHFVDQIAKLPLAFDPGERYLYGYNMDVLGRVVEVVSGMDLAGYFRQHIFEPLEMKDTHFYLPEEKYHRLVPLYDYTDNGLTMYTEDGNNTISIDYPKFKNAKAHLGGGGLSSTVMDYARFLQALLNDSEKKDSNLDNDRMDSSHRLLGRKTVELMTSDQFEQLNARGKGRDNKVGTSHALGFALTTHTATEAKSSGTYEWGGTFSTKFFVDPKEELIFVGMSQAVPRYHQEFYSKMTAIIYGAIDD